MPIAVLLSGISFVGLSTYTLQEVLKQESPSAEDKQFIIKLNFRTVLNCAHFYTSDIEYRNYTCVQ